MFWICRSLLCGSTYSAYYRFRSKIEIESARLYLTAQGIYDFYINGQEVAPDEWFNPGSTEYDSILAYNSYDVTDYLQTGKNAMGAILGEGWWTEQPHLNA